LLFHILSTPAAAEQAIETWTVDGVDVGLEQLRAGVAWVCTQYLGEVAPADRPVYLDAETRQKEPSWACDVTARERCRRGPGGRR
jgi:endonuclease YncB( thermonuclease family)